MSRVGRALRPAFVPILAIVTAFIVGSLFILVTDFENLSKLGTDPAAALGGAFGTVVNAYGAMVVGALGDPARYSAALADPTPRALASAVRPLTETLVAATPLIFTGLAVAVSFRSGAFNIGVEGQFVLGAFGAAVGAIALKDQPLLLIILVSTICGVLTGAFWGFIPGFLKARTGASEVITTIMLNYVAAQIVLFGLRSEFLRVEGSDQPISKVLSDFVRIPPLIALPAIRLHWGFVVALVMAVIVSWFLFKTTKGFELRAAGFNMTAARYAGMSASGSIILAMTLSGALAGLGGSMEVLGTVPQMSNDISSGYGFNAIALALLAGNRPFGIVLAALLFGALRTGGGLMQVKTGIPLDLLFFIQALVIMFVAAPGLIRAIWRIDRRKKTPDTPSAPAASAKPDAPTPEGSAA
ncbi:MAG TPA: ABC transporter permease [Candidatus Limnocylindrales bacterium]|nr:ABC transporter permease [Candidatus Limnocylindrales bacterium]